MEVGNAINAAWEEMEKAALEEMRIEGRELGEVHFQHLAMIRYAAQLTNLEVESPVRRIETATDMDRLIEAWEALYENKTRSSPRSRACETKDPDAFVHRAQPVFDLPDFDGRRRCVSLAVIQRPAVASLVARGPR